MKKSPGDEAKRWLDQAEEDLKSAKILLQNRRYDAACFFFQQVAEKALKSFLYGEGEGLVIGHSVTDLVKKCAEFDPSFASLGAEVNGLDGFYIPTRYPSALPDSIPARVYNATEAERAQSMAEKVIKRVKEKIKRKKK